MAGRTNTKEQPVPAGEPDPTPAEEVQPDPPAPAPGKLPPEAYEAAARTLGLTGGEPTAEELDARVHVPMTSRRSTVMGEVDFPLSVGEAIAEVTRRIDAIPKDRRASGSGGGYAFRGIDDALSALHPLLGDVGLVILPGQVVREVWETRATSSGGTLNVARLLVRYTFVGPDGSELAAEAWGEAGDSGDKATQKAHSQSYKTLVFQAFSIPTEASAADEPDATNPAARPFTEEEQERAGRAYDAALEADTVEKLAGVRHRALALLPVPVRMADGSLHPLSLLIDSRRRAIESSAPGGER